MTSALAMRRHLEHSHGINPTRALQNMTQDQLDRIHAVFHECDDPHQSRIVITMVGDPR